MKDIVIALSQQALREKLMRLLSEQGARCHGVELGMKVFEFAGGKCDLLILDLHLEDQNGDEICRDLHRSYPRLNVLMLIAEPDPWYRERCLKAGARFVLTYAETQEKGFLEIVRNLLEVEERIPLRVPVQYYIVESKTRELFSGESVDVSASGILIFSPRTSVEPGMIVDVKVGISPPLLARGEVVRITESTNGYRIAIRWLKFRAGDRERLRELLYAQAPEGSSSSSPYG